MSFQLKYIYYIIITGKGKGDMTIISQGIIFTKCSVRQSIFLHTMEQVIIKLPYHKIIIKLP